VILIILFSFLNSFSASGNIWQYLFQAFQAVGVFFKASSASGHRSPRAFSAYSTAKYGSSRIIYIKYLLSRKPPGLLYFIALRKSYIASL